MKHLVPLLLVLSSLLAAADPAKLGTLDRNSSVIVEGLYPVFQIAVPEGITEVQIRASVNNFQESFTLRDEGMPIRRYRCTGTHLGRPFYKADDQDLTAYWDGTVWQLTYASATVSGNYPYPWMGTCSMGGAVLTPVISDDALVYSWCSTGQGANGAYGTGIHDGAAELFFSNQTGEATHPQLLQRWKGSFAEAGENTAATAHYTFAAKPAAGTSVQIGSVTYTFRTSLSDVGDVLIATTLADTVRALTDAINCAIENQGTTFLCLTANPDATAEFNGSNTVTVTARRSGVYGNALAFAHTGLVGSGSTAFSGGLTFTALTAQLQPGGTPGRFVIFQPSRQASLFAGGRGDWMRQGNANLQWVAQFESPGGFETHPDGSQVWNVIHPIEWRSSRKTLQAEK